MGRHDGLLTHSEAAKILRLAPVALRLIVHRGLIRPAKVGKNSKDYLYWEDDIYAYQRVRGKEDSLPDLIITSKQALALSRANNRKLKHLYRFLGLDTPQLPADEESVYRLYDKAISFLEDNTSELTPASILYWATTINAIDEAYLTLLEQYSQVDTTWESFLDLANKLMRLRCSYNGPSHTFAYSCLDSARKNLRHVAYFYVRAKHGQKIANQALGKEAATEEVIAHLYPSSVVG